MWPEQWMSDAYASTCRVYFGGLLCFILLVGLYSRVVHALWIKHDDGHELTHQQQDVINTNSFSFTMYESDDVAITTITSTLIITNIVGNSLVCAVIMRNRDMRIPINYLLVNLAVADIIYAAFYIPKIISSHTFTHSEGVAGNILCGLLTDGALSWVGGASSVVTLVAIATERYYAVIYPHGHTGKLTIHKLKVIVSCSWIIAFIVSCPEFWKKIDRNSCSYAWHKEWMPKAYALTWRVYFGLSFTLMVGLYSRIIYTLWFKRNGDNASTHQQQGVFKVRKRVTLMVVTVSVIFGICWGTDSTMHLIDNFGSISLSSYAIPIGHTMIMFNSAVNPFAYALINQRFREKMKGMICCCSASVHVVREPQVIELTNKLANIELANTQPTNSTRPSFTG